MTAAGEFAIELKGIGTRFGSHQVHAGLDLAVRRGEILGLAGGSGSGKSVLLREMIGLQRPSDGQVRVLGEDLAALAPEQALALRLRWGVMFQRGGLFGALTVRRNVGLPLREHTRLDDAHIDQLAEWRLAQTGLAADAGLKQPGELSGGMLKRAALARALALDPELLFLDEPTSGLDPIGAQEFDDLIATLQRTLGLTVFMVTHDLDSLAGVCDRIAALADGKVIAAGPIEVMMAAEHPWLKAYFHGSRARRGSLESGTFRSSIKS